MKQHAATTAQKMKFSILRIWSHLLKKLLIGSFIFFVQCTQNRLIFPRTRTESQMTCISLSLLSQISPLFELIFYILMIPNGLRSKRVSVDSQWFKIKTCFSFSHQLLLKLSRVRGKRNKKVWFRDNLSFSFSSF